jgi:hypothetical protein
MPERASRAKWFFEGIFPKKPNSCFQLLVPLHSAIERGLQTNLFLVRYEAEDAPYSIQFVLFSAWNFFVFSLNIIHFEPQSPEAR